MMLLLDHLSRRAMVCCFIDLGHPHRAMAGLLRPPSHPCIALVELRRPGRLGGPEQDRRRIPDRQNISISQARNPPSLTYQAWVANKLPRQPQERLFEVVIRFSGDVVVLEVLLAMESDGLGLHFTLFDVDLVAAKDNGDLFADTDKVT